MQQREKAKADNRAARLGISTTEDVEDEEDEEMEDEAPVEGTTIADFAASIASRGAKYHNEEEDEDMEGSLVGSEEEWTGFDETTGEASLKKETSRKMFDKDFKSVVESSDVVLYVLDARDPEGTRSREVEKMVLNAARGEKRLILVLNKIDLVPKNVLNQWLEHLRLSFPTLPLRSSSSITSHTYNHKNLTLQSTSAAIIKSLKSYSQKVSFKRSLSVGIIGFPNVGKSSVINALLSRTNHGKAGPCTTGAEAGVTRSIKEIKLDGKVKLLDSPGIVFPSSKGKNKSENEARLVLMNAIPWKQVVDPLPAAMLVLRRLSTNQTLYDKMMTLYDLPAFYNDGTSRGASEFLIHVARKRGRLSKGGRPDIMSAAKMVLKDWCDGRLQWFTAAPEPVEAPVETKTSADKEIVSQWAAEFDLNGLYTADAED